MKYCWILLIALAGCASTKELNKSCYNKCMQNIGYATGLEQRGCEDGWCDICGDSFCGQSYSQAIVNADKTRCFDICFK